MPVISDEWLHAAPTQSVLKVLTEGGYQALLVGGCVRNALIDRQVSDIDIATDARPERVIALAEAAGVRAVPTGIDHGTVTLVVDGIPHEVTTFRQDVETDGRRAVVAFSDRVEDDARRRDFTMNALYATADGQVVDPLGGLPDLQGGRVRFIEDPDRRIAEDHLRILRFFRFHAWYGDANSGLDEDGLAACAAASDRLEALSKERVGAEILKLLAASDPAPSVAAMRAAGCLAPVLPGAEDRALAPLVHLEGRAARDPDAVRRLGSLTDRDPSDPLRLSKAHARRWSVLRQSAVGSDSPGALGYRLGDGDGGDALLLRWALLGTEYDPVAWGAMQRGAQSPCPVSATDLMPDYTGTGLGQKLRDIEERWIASDFTASRDDLLSS